MKNLKNFCFLFLLCFLWLPIYAQTAKLPIIGISGAHGQDGATHLNSAYVKSVLRAGGVPMVLPINNNPEVMKKMIASIDALIMTGGEDIDPLKNYNEDPITGQETINPERDAFDFMLIQLAVERGIPILGICRGHQMLNVVFGGTLYQDLPSQIKTGLIKHRQQAPGWYGTHRVEIEKNSVLAKVLGKTIIVTNSYHHQAVKDLAPGFVITARSVDGVVEAMEMTGNPQIFSVQFHPEMPTSFGSDEFLPIFIYLIELAGKNN